MFSDSFLHILVVVAIAWTALGVVILLGLLIRDWLKGNLW